MTKRPLLVFCIASCLAGTTGCASMSSYVRSDATLGRVVVYRNGVAYFERTAHLDADHLRLSVPADKVDDFLKSLTVVDAQTGEPAPVSYPTSAPSAETGLIDMKISLKGASSRDLRLSYVTEAPSWKPSYRITLGKDGKVHLQASAIVDNTSGEDWENVQLGVGSSSALSFRFDLRSVRLVQRETLRQDDLFAQAPPMGGPSYAQGGEGKKGKRAVFEFNDEQLAAGAQNADMPVAGGKLARRGPSPPPPPPAQAQAPRPDVAGVGRGFGLPNAAPRKEAERSAQAILPKPQQQAASQLDQMARSIQASSNTFVIEGYADRDDADKNAASLERANKAREQLIRSGVDPNRVVAVGAGAKAGRSGGVIVVEQVGVDDGEEDRHAVQLPAQAVGSEPIGTSHFVSKSLMTVPRGSSAMVSILDTDTEGEVVYFYDAEGPRGNAAYPFRAVRVKNPTGSVLESGPVTVFGEGKFIGEGMSEPIPASSMAFVPFALDRQISVEKKGSEQDRISRILTVQRGVFSTEVQHTRRSTLTLMNRNSEPSTVYVKHTVAQGYELTKAPDKPERLGSAYLFKVDLAPNGKGELVIEESTPLYKSVDIRSTVGMEQVTVYLSSEAVEGPLKAGVGELLKLHKDMGNTEQQIQTLRDVMQEYRARMDELHAQIVTLKAVRTAGPLMQNLERKLSEVSDKLSKSTIDLVALQEKLMVARVKFQDGVAELTLEKKPR